MSAKLDEQERLIAALKGQVSWLEGRLDVISKDLVMVLHFLYGASSMKTSVTPTGGNLYDDLLDYEDIVAFYRQVKKDYEEAQKNAGE